MIDFLITIPFSAYEGINQVPCHIEVTNLPSGITLGENTDSTDSTNGQIVLNVEKGNDIGGNINGNAVLTCTVTGKNGTQEITKKFSWFKNLQGKDGVQGQDAEFYTLESSINSLKKCTIETAYIVDELGNYIVDESDNLLYGYSYSDEITPKTITFTAYKQVGNKDRVLYPCRFVVYESQDGISYSPKYTSSKDESSITYSPTTTDLHHIKCILCKAGGISDQLDTQTIPVLHDFEGYDNAIRSLEERFSSVAFEIDNAEKSISQKATQEDINRTLSDYDGSVVEEIRKTEAETKVEVDKITNRVSEAEAEVKKKADGSVVTKLTDRVTEVEQTSSKWQATAKENSDKIGELKVRADKVEQRVSDNEGNIARLTTKTDEISSTVSGMTVGGTNLIRNSNDLIFALYYFVADIIDENGNTLIDETGNTLVAYY